MNTNLITTNELYFKTTTTTNDVTSIILFLPQCFQKDASHNRHVLSRHIQIIEYRIKTVKRTIRISSHAAKIGAYLSALLHTVFLLKKLPSLSQRSLAF